MAKRSSVGKVVIFNEEHNTVIVDKVFDADSDTVESNGHILPMTEARTFVDPVHGEPVYVFNMDVPAAIEAENLKKLRRSIALKNMFQFERGQEFDLIKFMPWIIIAALVVFR